MSEKLNPKFPEDYDATGQIGNWFLTAKLQTDGGPCCTCRNGIPEFGMCMLWGINFPHRMSTLENYKRSDLPSTTFEEGGCEDWTSND